MDIGRQADEIRSVAELGGDFLEVQGIVFMVGIGQVDGVEIQHVGAEVLHMVELVAETCKVAAPELELLAVELRIG